MPTTTVTANTNLVLVNTADNSNTQVNLPGGLNVGQIITIRDNQGAASSSNIITITPVDGATFDTGVALPDGLKIRQPFGAVTVSYAGVKNMGGASPQPVWNILNTFAFANPIFGSVDAMTVSSITFRDTLNTGNTSLLSVRNNQLVRDGVTVGLPSNWAAYAAISNVDMSNYSIINVSNINVSNINVSNINAQSYTLNGEAFTGGGGGTPSNWAAYAAISNVDMSNNSITNLSNLTMSGELNINNAIITISDNDELEINGNPVTGDFNNPKFNTVIFGNEADNISIANAAVDGDSYLKLNGPTYITDSLTLAFTNIVGPDGTSLTYNDVPIGSGDISQWATASATQDLNMSSNSIINASNITLTGILTIGETVYTGAGSTPTNWAAYAAISNVDMSNNSIINVSNINASNIDAKSYTLNGLPFTGSGGGTPSNWATYPASSNLNMSNYSISNASNITASNVTVSGTLLVGGVAVNGIGGGTPSNWATYPASSNLNMSNYSISNASNIEVKNIIEISPNTTLIIPDRYILTKFINGTNIGFTSLDEADYLVDIFYNNSLWVGGGDTNGFMYTSTDGTTWNKNQNAALTAGYIYNVVYASNNWVAVGYGLANQKIAYSSDGSNWSKNPNSISQILYCVGYNGSNKWVVGGALASGWTLATLTNITSDTVTPATGGFTNTAIRVLYGNNIWVAVGNDTTNGEIKYSTNGNSWTSATNVLNPGNTFFNTSNQGNALAYGNNYWLAGGDSNIYKSQDGSNFTLLYNFNTPVIVYDIKYESGSTFYAIIKSNTTGLLAKSTNNGSSWSIIANTFSNTVNRIGISYTPSGTITSNTLIGGGTLNTTNITVSNVTINGALTLNSNTFTTLVNPVGAYIEIRKTLLSGEFITSPYPLYIGNSIHITRSIGWWNLDGNDVIPIFSGIILLPNYRITYDYSNNGNNTLTRSNISNIPSYTALAGSYQNSLYYTLTYTPT